MQAILHLQNLPTLGMLVTVAWSIEQFMSSVIERDASSPSPVFRKFLIAIACAGILLGDHRLRVASLVTSLPAVLTAGLARGIHEHVKLNRAALLDPARMRLLHCVVGLLITLVCSHYISGKTLDNLLREYRHEDVPLMILNISTSSMAILLGQSLLLPLPMRAEIEPETRLAHFDCHASDAMCITVMTAAIGTASTLFIRRSWSSWIQMVCFFVALVLLSVGSRTKGLDGQPCKYTALANMTEWRNTDSESTVTTELVEMPSGPSRATMWRTVLLSLTTVSLWLVFLKLNFSANIHREMVRLQPLLDATFEPQIPLEVVISMYKEPIHEVAHLVSTIRAMPNFSNARVHIYVKDNNADLEEIKIETSSDTIVERPNIGREGETYLHHILHRWDHLAKHTVFLQADVHNPREFYPRMRHYFDPARTGMLNLGWPGMLCDCNTCTDNYGFHDTTHLFPEIHRRIDNSTECKHVFLSYKGQFIVSAQRVRGIDKQIYQDLHTALVDEQSWAHQEDFLDGQDAEDSMSAPIFGYTLERMWNLLFQCNDMEVAWKCASLLSGMRIGGDISDCQCFD